MKTIQFPPFHVEQQDVQGMYRLPDEIRFCKKCVISNQRPRITFDSEGVCSACRYAEFKHRQIDWNHRDEELRRLCDRFRRANGDFDVLVPCSGGKDSGFTAHLLKTQYGMHPLTVTWAPHWYTEIGRQNLEALVHSGISNVGFTPNGELHRVMTRLSFIHLGDPFQPFIYGQKNWPLRCAVMHNIPLIMFGENGEVEYGGDMKNAFKATHNVTDDMRKHYFSNVMPEDWAKFGITSQDLKVYGGPAVEDVNKVGVECHFLGYYKRWLPQENYYYCVENTDFIPNPYGRSEGTYSKYASLDDRLDGFHYYLGHIKFGIGRCTSDAAHEIRDGHLTREEGVALVKQYDGEFPGRHYTDFLVYTGLSDDEFHQVIDSWRSPHIWHKEDGQWKLRSAVWMDQG